MRRGYKYEYMVRKWLEKKFPSAIIFKLAIPEVFDLIMFYRGVMYLIEVKKEKKHLNGREKRQLRRQRRIFEFLCQMGFDVCYMLVFVEGKNIKVKIEEYCGGING